MLDPQIAKAVADEFQRQQHNIELIASENYVSKEILVLAGSVLTNKYAEGYPQARYYGGCECVDEVEELARKYLKQLFQAEYVNVQPHSGSSANMAAYMALLKPGAKILGMDLKAGGHLSHGYHLNFSGKLYETYHYGVDPQTEMLDYEAIEALAKQVKPQLIVAGASAYARYIDFKRFRAIADAVGAYLMVDMAHIAGLVAVGLHPSPFPYADIVTSTTHKTLRGPRGGIILCREKYGKAVDKAVFPGTQGGPLMHIIAAKAQCFYEALQPEFKVYMQQVKENARILAEALAQGGLRLVSGGTDNHLILVDLTNLQLSGLEAERLLDEAAITANKNAIPHDPLKANVTSGLRLGTAAMTTRGFGPQEFRKTATLIIRLFKHKNDIKVKNEVKAEVAALTAAFPYRI